MFLEIISRSKSIGQDSRCRSMTEGHFSIYKPFNPSFISYLGENLGQVFTTAKYKPVRNIVPVLLLYPNTFAACNFMRYIVLATIFHFSSRAGFSLYTTRIPFAKAFGDRDSDTYIYVLRSPHNSALAVCKRPKRKDILGPDHQSRSEARQASLN